MNKKEIDSFMEDLILEDCLTLLEIMKRGWSNSEAIKWMKWRNKKGSVHLPSFCY